jgi:hypothetical protein
MDWEFIKDLFKEMFWSVNSIATWIGIVGLILFFLPLWEGKMKNFLEKYRKPYALYVFPWFIVISVIFASYSMYENQQQKINALTIAQKKQDFATPDALNSKTFDDMNIRIADLARENFIIKSKTFENCHIYGPAVIYLNGAIITKCIFAEVTPEGAFIESPNERLSGVITLENCILTNCVLHKISIIGTSDTIQDLRKRITIISE